MLLNMAGRSGFDDGNSRYLFYFTIFSMFYAISKQAPTIYASEFGFCREFWLFLTDKLACFDNAITVKESVNFRESSQFNCSLLLMG